MRISLYERRGGKVVDYINPDVKEGWSGPGRRDDTITRLTPEDDALHIEVGKRNMYEWWYFDAHLDGGYLAENL